MINGINHERFFEILGSEKPKQGSYLGFSRGV